MSNARNLADIVTGNFDVPLGALDNVPPSNDASALTTGTLPVGRLPSSGVDASSLTTGTLPVGRLPSSGVNASSLTTGTLGTSRLPAGSVLQVVSVSTPAQQTFNTTSFANFVQLNCSITPTSASSKILVSYNIFIGNANDDNYNQFIAYRSVGGVLTALGLGDGIGGATRLSWGQNGPYTHAVYEVQNSSWQYLDSPATASTISYQLHARTMQTNIRTMYFNRPSDVADGNRMATTSSVTLMEIMG